MKMVLKTLLLLLIVINTVNAQKYSVIAIPGSNVNLDYSRGRYVGDFNNDGIDDFLNLNGDDKLQVSLCNGVNGFAAHTHWGDWAADGKDIFVGNFDGTGGEDLIWVDKYNSTPIIKFRSSNGSTFDNSSNWLTWNSSWGILKDARGFYVGDFDGDGKDDLLLIMYNYDLRVVRKTTVVRCDYWGNWSGSVPADIRIGKFNSDTKSDLLWVDKNGLTLQVKKSTGSSFDYYPSVWYSNCTGLNTSLGYYVGDFNGDGKDDFLNFSQTHNFQVATSTGTGFNTLTGWGPWGAEAEDIAIGKFNSDANSDLLWVDKNNASGATHPGLWASLSSGTIFNPATQWCTWGGLNSNIYNYIQKYLDAAQEREFNTIALYVHPDELEAPPNYTLTSGYLSNPYYRNSYKAIYRQILTHPGNFNIIVRIVLRAEFMTNADATKQLLWNASDYFLYHENVSSHTGTYDPVGTVSAPWNENIDFYHVNGRTRMLNFNNTDVQTVSMNCWNSIIDDVVSVANDIGKKNKIISFTLNSTPSEESENWYSFYIAPCYQYQSLRNNAPGRLDVVNTWQNNLAIWHQTLSEKTYLKKNEYGANFTFGSQLSGAFDNACLLRGTFNLANFANEMHTGDWINNADVYNYNHNFSMDYYTSIANWKGLRSSNEISWPTLITGPNPTPELNATANAAFLQQAEKSYNHGAEAFFVTNWLPEEIRSHDFDSLMNFVKNNFSSTNIFKPTRSLAMFIDPWSIYAQEYRSGTTTLVNENETRPGITDQLIRTTTNKPGSYYNNTIMGLPDLMHTTYNSLSQNGQYPIQFFTSEMLEKQTDILNSASYKDFRSIWVPEYNGSLIQNNRNREIKDAAKSIIVSNKMNLRKFRLADKEAGSLNEYQSTRASLASYKADDLLWVDKDNLFNNGTPNYPGLVVTKSQPSTSGFELATQWSDWGGLTTTRGYFVGDFNGDGTDDFLNFATDGQLQVVRSLSPTYNSFSTLEVWGNWNKTPEQCTVYGADIRIGDYNGDGKDDLLFVDKDHNRLLVRLSTGSLSSGGFSNSNILWYSNWSYLGNPNNGYYTGDFDGDGYDDFLYYYDNNSTFSVAKSNGANAFENPITWCNNGSGITASNIRIGDFNGDSKHDILWIDMAGDALKVRTSTGIGFSAAAIWSNYGGLSTARGLYVGDFNGDGMDDFLKFGCTNPSDDTLHVVVSMYPSSNAFSVEQNWGSWDAIASDIRVGNFNKPSTNLPKESIENTLIEIPTQYSLMNNFPNPFNPSTTISYSLPNASDVELIIFDIMGKEIKSFIINSQSAGYQNIVWDGTNNFGEKVSSGIYLYRFRAKSLEDGTVFTKSAKMMLMK